MGWQKARAELAPFAKPEILRLAEDVAIQIGLGRFFAAKLRADDPSLSNAGAMARALQTPDGARLYLEDRRARIRS